MNYFIYLKITCVANQQVCHLFYYNSNGHNHNKGKECSFILWYHVWWV